MDRYVSGLKSRVTSPYARHIKVIVEVLFTHTFSDVIKVTFEWILVSFLVREAEVKWCIASFVERFLARDTLLLVWGDEHQLKRVFIVPNLGPLYSLGVINSNAVVP